VIRFDHAGGYVESKIGECPKHNGRFDFTTEQLCKLLSIVSIETAAALPQVVARCDPKAVLETLKSKDKIFARRLEPALAQAIEGMLLLAPRTPFGFTSKVHDPDIDYRTRPDLYVWDDFRDRIVSKAVHASAYTSSMSPSLN